MKRSRIVICSENSLIFLLHEQSPQYSSKGIQISPFFFSQDRDELLKIISRHVGELIQPEESDDPRLLDFFFLPKIFKRHWNILFLLSARKRFVYITNVNFSLAYLSGVLRAVS